MSRSNRKTNRKTAGSNATRTAVASVVPATEPRPMVRATRDISRFSFEYQRDRVSRKAGASYFRVESADGGDLEMTIQEAQSLYNFLGKALNS